MMSEDIVACRPDFRACGLLRWMRPAMVAEARKVRFITALDMSHASSPRRSVSGAKSASASRSGSSPQISVA